MPVAAELCPNFTIGNELGADVTLFKDVRFQGRSSRFETDIRNLKQVGWDDLISSIRVQYSSRGAFRRPGIPGRPAEDPDRIVRRAYEDLHREPDPTGLRIYRSDIIDEGWSEAQVRDELRRSPEFRDNGTMTYAKAQDVVRRAYLEVFKREPDPASRPFVDKIFRDHRSQQDVERELRNSAEYRNRRRWTSASSLTPHASSKPQASSSGPRLGLWLVACGYVSLRSPVRMR